MFLAHICETQTGRQVQTAAEHCRNTARYAGEALASAGLTRTGYLLGLVHDCGKFKKEFAAYLENPNGVRGSVNHTFAGCRLFLEKYHAIESDPYRSLTAELFALAVGSHHGLFDCVDQDRKSGFLHRLNKSEIGYEESRRNFFLECISEEEFDSLFAEAHAEMIRVYEKLSCEDETEYMFQLSMFARLLLSAVIEGDRRDTAQFMSAVVYPEKRAEANDFWDRYLERVERRVDGFPQNSPINRARREISDRCRSFAEKESGVFRLNVPTGGGKTLSSLRYALVHAKKWGKERIVFTSPLLSILEQNAAVIREFIGDDSVVLEHHSNVLCTDEASELDHRELAVESWNAPIIITTLVQLLNTLFEGKTTSIRRFQGLCNSVIVIDEVQTVPPKMLTLFNLALEFLSKVCNATVLLCSATQPYLEKTRHPFKGCIDDVVPYDERLWGIFARTAITDAGRKTLDEIAVFAKEVLDETESLLVICNRKDEAAYLFEQLRDYAETSCHLSASMCPEHRRHVMQRMDTALEAGEKCLCVATQVIEAGVDVSFKRVIRLAAGMDSVVQAAGRCNRHGESKEIMPVYVVSCLGEDLSRLREIRDAKQATVSLLYAFQKEPQRFENDLASESAIKAYYERLYDNMLRASTDYQDYILSGFKTTLFELLSDNIKLYDEHAAYAGKFFLNQALKTAGNYFQVFDSNTRDVIVPYGQGTALIAELTAQEYPSAEFLSAWAKRAKAYSVSVYDWQLKVLENAVTEHAGAAVLASGFYDPDTGLIIKPQKADFLEV